MNAHYHVCFFARAIQEMLEKRESRRLGINSRMNISSRFAYNLWFFTEAHAVSATHKEDLWMIITRWARKRHDMTISAALQSLRAPRRTDTRVRPCVQQGTI